MKFVIFGLTVSSSWGNGHATIWRGLCSALGRAGHDVTFFERDVPYYASHRDLIEPDEYELMLYANWDEIQRRVRRETEHSDCAIVTSYCPDARAAADLALSCNRPLHVFYDLDTPITFEKLQADGNVDYIPTYGLSPFDLVLSYTGGKALDELRSRLGARRVAPLYGSVDPDVHRPAEPSPQYSADLSYLGTYASDRQPSLEKLFVEPARKFPAKRFLIGGSLYPDDFPWTRNIYFVRHVPPSQHPAFYSSSALTLSVTRAAMAGIGYCPSGRLFEAAACGTPVLSDSWTGLGDFFQPGKEILTAASSGDVADALSLTPDELREIGRAARERVLSQHTAAHRCTELLNLLGGTA